MQHNSLFVFDIETIPDTQAAKNLLDLDASASKEECRKALTDYHLKITDGRNSFIRQPFQKIVAISFLQADIIRDGDGTERYVLNEIRSGGNIESLEEELVKGFFSYLKKQPPRIVSYGGKNFDLPVLKYRAIKHGIAAPFLYKMGDKWNNYNQKYSLDWHCDLIDAFSDFGASTRVKMNELCAVFGLPGKLGIDGSMVADYYDSKKLAEIRDYCETDVVNTYLLYLHYQHHNGSLSTENFLSAQEDLSHYLLTEGEERVHLKEFLDELLKLKK
ncbi:MAG: putative PolB exonuclease-like 3'-5' exonuclease [Rickettsiales bacterium]|jgi:predicted PolB exonuclease-like 3'-5' exonuclease